MKDLIAIGGGSFAGGGGERRHGRTDDWIYSGLYSVVVLVLPLPSSIHRPFIRPSLVVPRRWFQLLYIE